MRIGERNLLRYLREPRRVLAGGGASGMVGINQSDLLACAQGTYSMNERQIGSFDPAVVQTAGPGYGLAADAHVDGDKVELGVESRVAKFVMEP
jgi:hypothetical protein